MVDKFRMATKAFIEKNGKILAVREAAEYEEGTNAGKWQIPGGRIEPGENYREALKREIREETGLEISIEEPFTMGEWRPQIKGDKWQIVAVFFRCKPETDEVEIGEEHTEYIWIEPGKHVKHDFIGNLHQKFEKYIQKYS